MRFVVSAVPHNSHLVRLLPGTGPEYSRMIVVTEEDDGSTLYLSGWIGDPLTRSEWRAARDELFPQAQVVRFDRWCPRTQAFRSVRLTIDPKGAA